MRQTIIEAIKSKKCLKFKYHGHIRYIEPHTYGNSSAGNNALRAWQTHGGSRRGGIPDWRLFVESEMRELELSGESFVSPRNGYKKGDKGMRNIYCEL